MLQFKEIALLIALQFAIFSEVSSSCQIKISSVDPPIITKKFGSQRIILENHESIVFLDEGSDIQAYCANGFRPFRTINNRHQSYGVPDELYHTNSRLTFKCISDAVTISKGSRILYGDPSIRSSIYYDDDIPPEIQNILYYEESLECTGPSYAMFESRDKLPNCEDSSYAMAAKFSTDLIIAGLCFDLEKLQLKYVSYKIKEPPRALEKARQLYPMGLNSNSLGESLQSINHLFKFLNYDIINSTISTYAETNFWLRIATFDVHSIVQTKSYQNAFFEGHKNFFNIIWWRNLRIGNWHRFTDLLEERSKTVIYNVYSGTSGELAVPVEKGKCVSETSTTLVFPGFKTTAPKFIWTYLNSTDEHHPENVVVIGYNSPYYEYFEKESTFLCKDICDEIEWLKPMQDTLLISALGIFYCCRLEDVVGVLDGFPIAWNDSSIIHKFSTTPAMP